MTSTIFFTDWINAPTMVFKPEEIQLMCQRLIAKSQAAQIIEHLIK